jgi:hypothetical protein
VTSKSNVDPDALLCALVLAPGVFARNRFFWLFENKQALKVRRRASRVRGMIRQLTGDGRVKAEITGEQVLEDGQVLLRYRVEELGFSRTTALSPIEAAALRFALFRARGEVLDPESRELVERAFERLSQSLGVPADAFSVRRPS